MSPGHFHLDRFVQAQDLQYDTAIGELRRGFKESHWIWFIFPQLRDLGKSNTARLYGLVDIEEATAFWEHPTLGPRLRECIEAMLQVSDKLAVEILGEVDALKFRSCLTLFREVAPSDPNVQAGLVRFFDGEPDALTLNLLHARSNR